MFTKRFIIMYTVLVFLIPGLFTLWDVIQDQPINWFSNFMYGVSLAFLMMLLELFLVGKRPNEEE